MSKDTKKEDIEETINETSELNDTDINKEETQEDVENVEEKEEEPKTELELAQDQVEELGKKLQETNDKYMRLSAEFDNYRKRTLKERMDLIKTASEKVFLDILPVMDNFERAMKAMDTASEVEPVIEGINLIYSKFSDFLKSNGLEVIETENKDFDIDLHEAITKMPAPTEDMKGKIIDCVERGYKMNEKVIRYAKVVVGE
ncbi:MAG: nucleotide exchange factor GrpE [Marinifilaceae bacterium]|jgi:molecular chaperone GrpE|nr:nucleotide exchange factor GrpE [Marinifilaceae bacterium]